MLTINDMEVNEGAFKFIKRLMTGSSLVLAVIYTVGHICIAMTVVMLMTNASLWESGAVALVEPTINGVWFYVLHSIYKKISK